MVENCSMIVDSTAVDSCRSRLHFALNCLVADYMADKIYRCSLEQQDVLCLETSWPGSLKSKLKLKRTTSLRVVLD